MRSWERAVLRRFRERWLVRVGGLIIFLLAIFIAHIILSLN